MNQGLPVDQLTASLLASCGLDHPNKLIALFHSPETGRRFWAQQARHVMEAAASGHRDSGALLDQAGIAYEVEPATGEPVPMLLEVIERQGCDAVIMGTHGHGALRAALLGSVSHGLLQQATVPVTLVRPVEPPSDDE